MNAPRRTVWWSRLATVVLLLQVPLAMGTPARGPAPLLVRFPAQESQLDARRAYPIAVLKLALQRSGVPHRLEPSRLIAPQTRTLALVELGEIDVMWSVPTGERVRRLRMVPYPVDRGLIGWRMLLVRQEHARDYQHVARPADLAMRTGIQGHDWPDLAVLRGNGLRIAAGGSYDSLFDMLARGRADYFPRAVSEVEDELAARGDLRLAVAEGITLHYPSALVFFVRRENTALADALGRGLQAAQRDGSLDALFRRMHGPTLARLQLERRRVIALRNPDLPAGLPVRGGPWWYVPGEGPAR